MGRIANVIGHELREALPPFLFFFVAFHMVGITKSVILEGYHLTAAAAAISTVGALLVAKAVLLVEHMPIARWFGARGIYNVLWKMLLFGFFALLFRLLEEWIHGLIDHSSVFTTTEGMIDKMTWAHFLVIQMWLFAFLFLFTLVSAYVRSIGAAQSQAVLLEPVGDEQH